MPVNAADRTNAEESMLLSMTRTTEPGRIVAGLLAVGLVTLGCTEKSNGAPGARLPTIEEMPESVAIQSGHVVAGFHLGKIREKRDVGSFRISRFPITNGEYRACVDAGACLAPVDGCVPGAVRDGESLTADDAPSMCSGIEGAKAYCAWVGGTLPTLEQWFLAARGADARRFPWGADAADCEHHANGASAEGACASSAAGAGGKSAYAVGQHPAGASSAGLEDLLMPHGELLGTAVGASFPPCSTSFPACVSTDLPPAQLTPWNQLKSMGLGLRA